MSLVQWKAWSDKIAKNRNLCRSAMLDRILHHGRVLKCGPRRWRTKLDAENSRQSRKRAEQLGGEIPSHAPALTGNGSAKSTQEFLFKDVRTGATGVTVPHSVDNILMTLTPGSKPQFAKNGKDLPL